MRAPLRYGPPLVLMALIFAFSAQPDLSTGLGTWDLILRKLAHMAEYGLLWFLWHRALGLRRPLAAAAITLAYAASDELHQTFVEGRNGSPLDVLIDALGVALAAALYRRRRPLRGRVE
jgi:VanZ family protein